MGFIAAVIFSGCNLFDDTSIASSSTQVGNAISLQGRVVDKNGQPISGIITKLAHTGLTDTTDAAGQYFLQGNTEIAALAKSSNTEILDTLLFIYEDYQITSLEILKWVDVLKDIQIDWRKFSGAVIPGDIQIGKIEAVLSGGGIPEQQPIIAQLYYDTLSQTYEGGIYFPTVNENQNFQVQINIYDIHAVLNNQSAPIHFNSLTNVITIPTTTTKSYPLTVSAGNDTTVNIGDMINLHGSVQNSYEGTVVKWEWNIAGAGFIHTLSGDTSIPAATSDSATWVCIFRATDELGNFAQDTITVYIQKEFPEYAINIYGSFLVNEPILFVLDPTPIQQDSVVTAIIWEDGITQGGVHSTDFEHEISYPNPGSYIVRIKVENDDGPFLFVDTTITILPADTSDTDSISTSEKILVTNFYFSFHNNESRALNVALVEQIGKEVGFEVEVINTSSDFTPDKLNDVQVLVMQNLTAPGQINPEMQLAIIDWVENGGGSIFAIGATLDGSFAEWDWLWTNGIYGHYVPHSTAVPAQVFIDPEAFDETDSLHPILEGIENFNGRMGLNVNMAAGTIDGWTEEWFNWNNYFRGAPNLKILLSMNTDSYDCNCQIEDDHPALWITEEIGGAGGGSISYCIVGASQSPHQCSIEEYQNNNGANCDPLLKHLWKNIILYQIRKN